jgi:hypothetical protein
MQTRIYMVKGTWPALLLAKSKARVDAYGDIPAYGRGSDCGIKLYAVY